MSQGMLNIKPTHICCAELEAKQHEGLMCHAELRKETYPQITEYELLTVYTDTAFEAML